MIDQHGGARLRELRTQDYHTTHPREYCEEEWRVVRFMLVGDPANVERMGPGLCDLPNEWPVNLARHMERHFGGSVQKLDVPRERVAKLQTSGAHDSRHERPQRALRGRSRVGVPAAERPAADRSGRCTPGVRRAARA